MSVEHIINRQHLNNQISNNEGVQLEAIKQNLMLKKLKKKPHELILPMTGMPLQFKNCYLSNRKKPNNILPNSRSTKFKIITH